MNKYDIIRLTEDWMKEPVTEIELPVPLVNDIMFGGDFWAKICLIRLFYNRNIKELISIDEDYEINTYSDLHSEVEKACEKLERLNIYIGYDVFLSEIRHIIKKEEEPREYILSPGDFLMKFQVFCVPQHDVYTVEDLLKRIQEVALEEVIERGE